MFERVGLADGVRRHYAVRNLSTRPDLRVLLGLEVAFLLAP